MKYNKHRNAVEKDKKAMQLYIDGKISADEACELIGTNNNNTKVTPEDFFRCTWAWGFLREPDAREHLQKYKDEKRTWPSKQ